MNTSTDIKNKIRTHFPAIVRRLKYSGKNRECCVEIIDHMVSVLKDNTAEVPWVSGDFKRAIVFLNCLKSLPQEDEGKVESLIRNLHHEGVMFLIISVFADNMDLVALMQHVEDVSGDMLEGEYLEDMNVIKTMYDVKELMAR